MGAPGIRSGGKRGFLSVAILLIPRVNHIRCSVRKGEVLLRSRHDLPMLHQFVYYPFHRLTFELVENLPYNERR